MQRAQPVGVAAENPLLDGLRAQQVERDEQELLAGQFAVMLAEHGGQVVERPRGGLAAQQRVQHRHEVRLAGAERAVQVDALGRPGAHRLRDQAERLVEVVHQPVGQHVVAHRRGRVGDTLGELEDEVAVRRPLRDVDDVAQQRLRRRAGHTAPGFRSCEYLGLLCLRDSQTYRVVSQATFTV